MCGIAGWVDWKEDLTSLSVREITEKMNNSIAHRGPDAHASWYARHCVLTHTRLIVVDPAGGGQPMIRERGGKKYVLVYNGELYNTEDLRRELQARGHIFSSNSDTEVVLIGYIEWGERCVGHYNGIFAFAVWNEENEKLFMARDRLGVKPLFYSSLGTTLLFGSELKTILAHPSVSPLVDSEGLAEVFALGPARTPGHGVFKQIAELKAGGYLIYDRNGLREYQYWKLKSQPHEHDFETTREHVRDLFCDTVSRQLVADVPVCTLLSGGLDSSAITAVAAKCLKEKGEESIATYSVDFLDNSRYFEPNIYQPNSDLPWIKMVSEYLKTRHHSTMLDTSDLVPALDHALWARDLPGMTDVDASLYLFCDDIKKGATVALSGECADEIFGGYPWFHLDELIHADTFPWSRNLKLREEILSPGLLEMIKPREYIKQRYHEALSEVPALPGESAHEARIREIFYLTITRWMPTLLDRKDRMSMAVALEVRVPYCDHRLVEYAWNIPWEIKNWQGREKGILREALKGLLPEEVLWRKKSPYPKTYNPTYLYAVKDLTLKVLNDPSSPILPLINASKLRSILKSNGFRLSSPWFGQLMKEAQFFAYIVQVNQWLKSYNVQIA
ncbi:MAG: asparagine synthase (glutamine-hydrolyzing) [Bacillota bacterium]